MFTAAFITVTLFALLGYALCAATQAERAIAQRDRTGFVAVLVAAMVPFVISYITHFTPMAVIASFFAGAFALNELSLRLSNAKYAVWMSAHRDA